ncbi:hypothetical protein [Bacillus suaedae]|uniref:Uncharacterized protein n=1 Tax=Halalkalibacter suaedae TaxID=2822140 RepID=A0A940WTV7_9BACI|nr:hypothetical protein [Bacillus suaedae]MBP3950347.1 hypothetical protein [Bacillus suaedae]
MLEIQIQSTNVRYQDNEVSSINVQFQARDPEGTINLNGYIPLKAEEYAGNESLSSLTVLVRTKLIERLQIQPTSTVEA